MFSLVIEALLAAIEAHDGQKRKDGSPYVLHPIRVAEFVKKDQCDENVIAAAYLHDVKEDIPKYDLSKFPKYVLFLVDLLTKTKCMNKKDSIEKLCIDSNAVLIKMADRFDNFTNKNNFTDSYKKRNSVQESTCLLLEYAIHHKLEHTFIYQKILPYQKGVGGFQEKRNQKQNSE